MHVCLLLAAFPLGMLASLVLLPSRLAQAQHRRLRQWTTTWTTLLALGALILAGGLLGGWLPTLGYQWSGPAGPISLLLIDPLAALMLALVSCLGWVVCRFSHRYLDGEPEQGAYYRWLAVTLAAVGSMVICGNLLGFLLAWIATSLGLHGLLTLYHQRPAAHEAAWTKFIISRGGDALLLVACLIVYQQLNTLDFQPLIAILTSDGFVATPTLQLASSLLAMGAMIKSAQVPFHVWLPQTMETPTPVSALMHAGIVNAGGFLLIRLSPLVSLSATAMSCLAIGGLLTLSYGAIVMLTQTSIKRSLAYSTVAQMGFMMLQCGLGAYTAAMLHIIAHALYKAHAFLSSGSVLATPPLAAATTDGARRRAAGPAWLLAGTICLAWLGLTLAVLQIAPWTKPGGWPLIAILWLALASWLARLATTAPPRLLLRSSLVAGGLCLSYLGGYWLLDRGLADSLPHLPLPTTEWPILAALGLAFAGLLAVQHLQLSRTTPTWLRHWHVHASHGFYLEAWFRKTYRHLVSQ